MPIMILSLLSPMLAFPFSLYAIWKTPKKWREYIFAISMFFGHMSYCYTPLNETDLTRYWAYIYNMSGLNLFSALSYRYMSGDTVLYSFNFLGWIVVQLGDLHLLSAISTFLVYYIALYITCCIGENENVKWTAVCSYIIIVICLLNWRSIANNIRNVLSFSIVGLAVFRDIYQKKKNLVTLLFYIIPVFLHPTSILFIAIRFVINITSKFKVILIVIITFITHFVNFIYNYISYLNIPLVGQIISMAYNYLNDTSSEWGLAVQASRYHAVDRILSVGFAVFVSAYYILNSYPISKTIRPIEQNKETAAFQNFSFIAGGIFTLTCASMLTPGYWRFYSALVIFGGIFFIPYTKSNLYKKISLSIKTCLIVFCFANLAMHIYEIRIGFKNIISEMFVTCPIYVFFKDIISLM